MHWNIIDELGTLQALLVASKFHVLELTNAHSGSIS